jgi:prevent-host-death family protein
MASTKTTKSVPAFEAKTHFGQLLDEVDRKKMRFLVKRRGKPVAVIMGIEEFEDLLEIAAEQADEEFQASLEKAKREYQLGEVIAPGDLRRETPKRGSRIR